MSNTMKSLIFIISMFVFLFYFYIVSMFIGPLALQMPPNTYAVFSTIVIMVGYIVALYSQAVVRIIMVSRGLKDADILMEVPVKPFKRSDKVMIYVLPAIGILLPIVQTRSIKFENIIGIIAFVVLLIVVDILFFIHGKTMKIYVTDKGLFIRGIDLRLELPIPTHYTNASGFYPFDKLDAYLMLEDSIQLYHRYDIGVISIPCDEEQRRQFKGLMVAHKIPDKRF